MRPVPAKGGRAQCQVVQFGVSFSPLGRLRFEASNYGWTHGNPS